MKKVISVLLVLTVLFLSCSSLAFAAEKCNCGNCPVIYVHGAGEPLYINRDSENQPPVSDSSSEIIKIMPKLILGIILKAVKNDYTLLGEAVLSLLENSDDSFACDNNGDSKYDVYVKQIPVSTDGKHEAIEYGQKYDNYNVLLADYRFKYDWRLCPVENAEKLHDYISQVKKYTKHDKVIVMAHSEGNNVLSSYLYLYGNEDFEKLIFMAAAFQGITMEGVLLAGEYSLYDKGDYFEKLICDFLIDSPEMELIKVLAKILNKYGVFDLILNDAQDLLDNTFENGFYDYIFKSSATKPSTWSFVPDEYYDRAMKKAFEGKTGYDKLIEKIELYHNNVQKNVPKLIQDAIDNGVSVSILSAYGLTAVPVGVNAPEQADITIDTRYTSIGATCAPVGETFPDGYVQQVECDVNYVSPDMMIDASTCKFPDNTWFVRDLRHQDFPPEYCKFIWALCNYDGQSTVTSFDNYSQFMAYDYKNKNLYNVTGKAEVEENYSLIDIVGLIVDMVK